MDTYRSFSNNIANQEQEMWYKCKKRSNSTKDVYQETKVSSRVGDGYSTLNQISN